MNIIKDEFESSKQYMLEVTELITSRVKTDALYILTSNILFLFTSLTSTHPSGLSTFSDKPSLIPLTGQIPCLEILLVFVTLTIVLRAH